MCNAVFSNLVNLCRLHHVSVPLAAPAKAAIDTVMKNLFQRKFSEKFQSSNCVVGYTQKKIHDM